MRTGRFERIALAMLLLGGYAGLLGHSGLTGHARAQSASPSSGAVPSGPAPTAPTQSPTVNPSSPNTVQQPSYTPSTTPSTPSTTSSSSAPSTSNGTTPNGEATSAPNENSASTTARSERQTSVAKMRSAHHHYRGRSALVTYACGHLGCVRTYAWAFPCQYYSRYCLPQSFNVYSSPY
jgi:hypothetical protein